jgi:hypothetical protein
MEDVVERELGRGRSIPVDDTCERPMRGIRAGEEQVSRPVVPMDPAGRERCAGEEVAELCADALQSKRRPAFPAEVWDQLADVDIDPFPDQLRMSADRLGGALVQDGDDVQSTAQSSMASVRSRQQAGYALAQDGGLHPVALSAVRSRGKNPGDELSPVAQPPVRVDGAQRGSLFCQPDRGRLVQGQLDYHRRRFA